MHGRSTKQRRAAMRRREGFVRDGEYWVPKYPPTEWVPLSARYPEFFSSPWSASVRIARLVDDPPKEQ